MVRAERMGRRGTKCCVPAMGRVGAGLAVLLVLAACTPGGQFDPTELLNSSMFDTKKKLKGDRIPVFPNGVPGTTAGVPPDLVKGYQPPPDEAADAAAQAGGNGAASDTTAQGGTSAKPEKAEAAPQPKPKAKPRPKLARAPAQP